MKSPLSTTFDHIYEIVFYLLLNTIRLWQFQRRMLRIIQEENIRYESFLILKALSEAYAHFLHFLSSASFYGFGFMLSDSKTLKV